MISNKDNNQLNIVKSDRIIEIKNHFINFFGETRVANNGIKTFEFYKFVNTDLFIYLYKEIINENFKYDLNEICVQPTPTFRKFLPQAHGTSFHNDYLYGHGKHSKTIWIPICGLDSKNSVLFLEDKFHNDFPHKNLAFNYSIKMENELIKNSISPSLGFDEGIVFGSNKIHGSPKNNSSQTRYSFDFRISKIDDPTSTKHLATYLYYLNNQWVRKPSPFKNKKFLKYICGGKNKDTLSQHLIIESISEKYDINIVAQEAEIERFGHEILRKYLNGQIVEKDYDSIIIASSSIIDAKFLNEISKSNVKVYGVLEGKFLN